MFKKTFTAAACAACLFLAGCSTTKTELVHANGQRLTCGGQVSGSIAFGLPGYYAQQKKAEACVAEAEKEGFKKTVIKSDAE